jgi:hypothetical protein
MSDEDGLVESSAATPAATSLSLQPGWLRAGTANLVWQGLRELHLRAVGSDFQFTTVAGQLNKNEAFAAYGSAVACTLGQIAAADDGAAQEVLGSLAGYGGGMGTLDGLESPFLSALSGAFRAGATDAVTRAAAVWRTVGQPRQLGGGALTSPVVSGGGVIALVSAEDLAQLDAADGAGALVLAMLELFRADEPRNRTAAEDRVGAAARAIGSATVRAAAAVAGAAELAKQLPAGAGGPPAAVAPITRVLERVQVDGQPFLRPSRTVGSIAQGKLIVVDTGVMVLETPTSTPPHAGPPIAVTPRLPTLDPSGDGPIQLGASSFWRSAVAPPVPAFTVAPAALDSQVHVRGHTAALPALPRLRKNGTVNPRGLLAALLDPPPSPAGSPDDLIVDARPGQIPEFVLVVPTAPPPLFIKPEKPEHAIPAGELEDAVRAIPAGELTAAVRAFLARVTRSG